MQMAIPKLLLPAVLCLLASAPAWSQQPQAEATKNPTKAELNSAYQRICKLVAETYNKPVPIDWQTTSSRNLDKFESFGHVRGAAGVALSSVGDARLRVLSPGQVEDYLCRLGSGYVGIGISYEPKLLVSEGMIIESVAQESSAADAGLKAGDLIVSVDGKRLKGLRWEKVEPLFEGDEKTVMKLEIKRDGGVSTVSITRNFKRSLGLEVNFFEPNSEFEITRVMYSSPAKKAGIKEGDIFRGLNGNDAERATAFWIKNQTGTGPIGTEIDLKMEREGKLLNFSLKRDIVEDWSKSMSGWYSQNYDGPGGKGFSRSGFSNLDWTRLVERLDGDHESLARYHPGLILDLRGASGDDPELAARIAARFVPEGEVIRYSERKRDVNIVVSYHVQIIAGKHYLIRSEIRKPTATIPLGSTLQQNVEILEPAVVNRLDKLVVIIDGETKGTPEALAQSLRLHANATLVGSATAGSNSLVKTSILDYPEKIYVQVPTYTLVNRFDNPLTSIKPDKSVLFGEPLESAKDVLAGRTFYNDPGNIAILVVALMAAFMIYLAVRRAGRDSKNAPGEIAEEPGEPLTLRQRLIVGVLFVVALTLVILISVRVERIPDAKDATPELEAELRYNPEKHQKWEAMFRQLEKEIEGPIKFTLVADPDATDWIHPGIRAKYQWVDSTGKVLSSGYNGTGAESKEEMVEAIKMAETNLGYQYKQKSFKLVTWHRQTPVLKKEKP